MLINLQVGCVRKYKHYLGDVFKLSGGKWTWIALHSDVKLSCSLELAS